MCALLVDDDTCQRTISLQTNSEAEVAITTLSSPNIQNKNSADAIELGKYFD